MTERLTYGSKPLGEFEVSLQGGQPALWGHILNFQLTARLTAAEGESLILHVEPFDVYLSGKYVGSASPLPGGGTLIQHTWADTEMCSLRLYLEPRMVQAVEELRNGGGLTFRLQGCCWISDQGSETYLRCNQEISIIQGVWVPLLAQMGYQRMLLLELPIPDSNNQNGLSEATELLSRSQTLIAEGKYTEAVGLCRDVLEVVSRILKDTQNSSFASELFRDIRSKNKSERIQMLRYTLKVLTHPARHRDEIAVAIEWTRNDATSIVAITTAILQMLE
jgi:hypothetical protein